MITKNIKVTNIRLDEKIKGFYLDAKFKKPELGDIYISALNGYLKTWRHKEPGKMMKVVLKPLVTVDLSTLPRSLLITGGSGHFLSDDSMSHQLTGITLSDKWQANVHRNCPFKPGTVMVEVKMFHDINMMTGRGAVEARTVSRWENVAQFRVTGLCPGVTYGHEVEDVNYDAPDLKPHAPTVPFTPLSLY